MGIYEVSYSSTTEGMEMFLLRVKKSRDISTSFCADEAIGTR